MIKYFLASLIIVFCHAQPSEAQDLRLPSIFSDHGILQANAVVPIWGWAKPGAIIEVSFGKLIVSTRADKQGYFSTELPSMDVSFEPRRLTVYSEGETLTREDILVGEVWLAAGQSNMVWELEDSVGGRDESISSDDRFLRLFEVVEDARLELQSDVSGKWIVVQPRSARRFSAVGYFFGQRLREEIDAPVGIVQIAYGGTRIEAWTSRAFIEREPIFEDAERELKSAIKQNYQARRDWLSDVSIAISTAHRSEGIGGWIETYVPPKWPGRQVEKNTPTVLFNAMLNPIIAYESRGMVWYQGESNRDSGRSYSEMLRAFISMLRQLRTDDYPVGVVQIAPVAEETDFPEIWLAQLDVAQSDTNVGLVVTTDVAELSDIHPRKKKQVGERLANWSLSQVYQVYDAQYSGPLIRTVSNEGRSIRLQFDFGSGLTTMEGAALDGFTAYDKVGEMTLPVAQIDGDTVRLLAPPGFRSCAIEYEMRPDASPTLTNSSGLPASPFRIEIPHC